MSARAVVATRRELALVYVLFLALACVYTYPLVLDIGGRLRGWNDPYLFTWILVRVAEALFTEPWRLFDTNIFHPHGYTLAYSEPLIGAALAAGPVHLLSGNPVATYNVTLLAFQALGGAAAYWAGLTLTGSRAGALVVGLAFALSPFKTGYYNFINLHLSWGVPVVLVLFVRYWEQGRRRDLVIALVLAWLQAATIWYAGVPLALLLVLAAGALVVLRPGSIPWSTVVASVLGGVVLLVVLAPVAWPYLVTSREMGFERTLADVNHFRADLLSYLDAGRDHLFYRLVASGRFPGLFPGFVVYGLAAVALAHAYRALDPGDVLGRWWRALAGAATLLGLPVAAAAGWRAAGGELPAWLVESGAVAYALAALPVLGAGALVLLGLRWRRGTGPRRLGPAEWTVLAAVLAIFFALLTLGPIVHVGGTPVGVGIHRLVYELFPGFNAIRISLRLAYLPQLLLALVAAFGLALWQRRAGGRGRALVYLAPLVLAVEYLPAPLRYQQVDWHRPPAVYRWLAEQPGDFAVMEFPTKHEGIDSLHVFWSLYHGKRLVNGVSGFYPPLTEKVAYAVRDLPSKRQMSVIERVHGLRYLVVHLDLLPDAEQRSAWDELLAAPLEGLRLVERFEGVAVFELERRPVPQAVWRRAVATRAMVGAGSLTASLSIPEQRGAVEQFVDASLNERRIARFTVAPGDNDVSVEVAGPLRRARPNLFELRYGYRLGDTSGDPAYAVGATGGFSPVDLSVESAGRDGGDRASIVINGVERSRHRRGYNLVAVDPASGGVIASAAFDPLASEAESIRLAEFVDALPVGSVVIVALKKAGARALTGPGRAALRRIGAAADPRQRSELAAHLVVGVVGAEPGTAIERSGGRVHRVRLGHPADDSMVVRDFGLR